MSLPRVEFCGAIVLSMPDGKTGREVADAKALLQVNILRSVFRERGLQDIVYVSDYNEADTTETGTTVNEMTVADPVLSIGEITTSLTVQVRWSCPL